jgi:hypothetical protein
MAVKSRVRLKQFQKKDGLPVTGRYDAQTRAEIVRARKGKPSQTVKAKKTRRAARTAAADDPALVTAPLTPSGLKSEVDAAVRQKYGNVESGLNSQVGGSDLQQGRIGGYYQDYLRKLQEAQMNTAGAYDRVGQGVDSQIGADTASSASPEAQQALAARKALLESQKNTAGLDRAAGQEAFGRLQANAKLGEAQAHERETARKGDLLQKLRDLQQEKGDYGTTLARDARTAERNNQLQRETLGLNTAKAQNDVSSNALKAKLSKQAKDEANQLSRARLDETVRSHRTNEQIAQERVDKASKPKPKKHKPLGQTDYQGRQAILNARQQYKRFGRNYQRYVKDANKHQVPLPIAHAGYELESQGYVGPNTAKQLKDLGVRVPSAWRKKPSRNADATRNGENFADILKGIHVSG